MKYVKCVYNGLYSGINDNSVSNRLTINKIYEVLDIATDDNIITIKDNLGDIVCYLMVTDVTWFVNADDIVRDNKINLILNK